MGYFAEIILITPFFYLLPIFVARALFGVKVERQSFIGYLITAGGGILIVFWLLPEQHQIPSRIFLSMFFMLMMFLIYVKADILTMVYSFLTSTIILLFCELFAFLISGMRFARDYLLVDVNRSGSLQYNLLPFLSCYLVVYAIYFIKKNSMGIRIPESREFGITSVLTALIVMLAAFIVMSVERAAFIDLNDPSAQLIFVQLCLLIILTLVVCGMFIRQAIREKKRSIDLERAQQALVELYDSTRVFRHNYRNSLIALSGYCNDGDLSSLREMLNGLNQEITDVSLLEAIPDIAKINDSGFRWLLLSKYLYAVSKEIAFSVFTDPDIDIRLLAKNDLHAILGTLLDNAIDAADASEDKAISLSMVKDEGDVLVSVRNSYAQKPDISRIFDKNYTTKEKHEGLGLYRVKRILSKYDNVFLDVKTMDSAFQVDINIQRGYLVVE